MTTATATPKFTKVDVSVPMLERAIRSQAHNVVNQIQARETHPTYGYTKASIRAEYHRLEGIIGMYMFATTQANHTGVPHLARFDSDLTTESVRDARQAMERL